MESVYKFSQYNIKISERDNGDVFLFNSYSSDGYWISRVDYDDIKDKKDIDLGDVPVYLEKAGFIVPIDTDEYQRFQNEVSEEAHRNNKIHFIIATTKACNYRCQYCFEGQHLSNEKMQQDTMDAVVEYIIKKCKEITELEEVILQWFGGEPLLYQEPIRCITEKLKEKYAEEHHIKIRGHITTNGKLLTPDVTDKMISDYNISSVQITLDGMAHDYARIKGSTEDDFYKVIENIRYAQDKLKVHIRLNLYVNLESIKELIDYIHEEKLNVFIYIAHIFDVSQTPEKYQNEYKVFTNNHEKLMEYIIENNYTYLIGGIQKPVRRRLVCKANADWQYAIDIYGNLYRCVEMIMNPQYSVGNVRDGITNHETNNMFIENPLYDKCKTCAYLPLCLGKCTMERIIENKGIDCNTVKEFTRANIMRAIQC